MFASESFICIFRFCIKLDCDFDCFLRLLTIEDTYRDLKDLRGWLLVKHCKKLSLNLWRANLESHAAMWIGWATDGGFLILLSN